MNIIKTLSGSILAFGCTHLRVGDSYKLNHCRTRRAHLLLGLELVWLATLWLVVVLGRPPITIRHSIIRWVMLLDTFIDNFPSSMGQSWRKYVRDYIWYATLFSARLHAECNFDINGANSRPIALIIWKKRLKVESARFLKTELNLN